MLRVDTVIQRWTGAKFLPVGTMAIPRKQLNRQDLRLYTPLCDERRCTEGARGR